MPALVSGKEQRGANTAMNLEPSWQVRGSLKGSVDLS